MDEKKFAKERRRQIEALIKGSTPTEKRRIKKGLRDGRRLRKEVVLL